MPTLKSLQVLLLNANYSVEHSSFVCTQLNGSKYLLSTKNNSIKHQRFVYTELNDQTVLFLTIQFMSRHLFALSLNVKQFYLTIDRNLSDATTPGQRGLGSNGIEGVLYIPQSSKIGTSPSEALIKYPGYSLGCLTLLQRCSQCILPSQLTGLRFSLMKIFK